MGKGAGGGDGVAFRIQRTAAQQADDAALALGVGNGTVAHLHIIAITNEQQRCIAVRAAVFYGVVIKNRIIDFQQVLVGGVRIHIHGVAVAHVFLKVAMVDPHIALGRAGGTCADINGRGRAVVGRNVAIEQHIAHMLAAAAAYVQGRPAAAVVAVTGSIVEELGIIAACWQFHVLLIADGEQVAAYKHGTAAAVGLVFLKPVVRAQGQGALVVIHSAAASRGSAVVGEGAVIQQGRYRNGRRVNV